MLEEIDRLVTVGRFASRSDAIRTMVTLYNERERPRRFFEMLSTRSNEARKKRRLLVPLDETS